MKLKPVFLITAAVTLIGGLLTVFIPVQLMEFFSGRPLVDKAPVLYIQWFGVAHFGFAVLAWLARSQTTGEARRMVLTTLLVYAVLGTVVTGLFQLRGLLNAWGWVFPAHLAVLGSWYAYILFRRRDLIG